MAYEFNILERYLAGNPIIIGMQPRTDRSAHYRIYVAYDLNTPIFNGVGYQPDENNYVEVNVSSLFSHLKSEAGVNKYYITLVDTSFMEYGGVYFTVYGGGISKLMLRQLNSASIFTTKLKNTEDNFFLTTRTNGNQICIPENEANFLYYYAKGHKFHVKVSGQLLATYDHSADVNESMTWLYLPTLRMLSVTNLNRWPSELEIHTDNGYSCSILITEAKQKSDYAIMFRNSWGAWDQVSVDGVMELTPTFSEPVKISTYDPIIQDFVKKQKRKEITTIYTATLGYKTADERLLLLDMLCSEDIIFKVKDTYYDANVSTTSTLFDSTNNEPINIDVTIELLDVETNFNPIMEDASYYNLATNNNDDITTASGADIIIN